MGFLSRLLNRKAEPPAGGSAPAPGGIEDRVRAAYELQTQGNEEEALRLFQEVLEEDPRHPDALYFVGFVAARDGRELEAIDYLIRAAEARPNDAPLHFVLAGILYNVGRWEESYRAFEAGLKLHPDDADMAGNMWMAMLEAGRDEEARLAIEKARDAGMDSSQLDATLAGIYRDHGRIEESIASYRKVMERRPDDHINHSNLLFTLNYSDRFDAAQLLAEHRGYAARFARPYVPPPPERTWPRKLRIGYVSPDFRAHVVAFFIEPILQHHDRQRFEVFCYYSHRADDPFTGRLRSLADHWCDCVHMSDVEMADRIRADRIDILVDLAGHTGANRLQVMAMKPAPVQATYLGYPGTTGLGAIDYRISDARADPPGVADTESAERLIRLPDCFHCYRPPADAPEVGPLPAAAAGHVTFGCFNNFSKLSPVFFETAARVLAAVPNSRLWLKSKALGTPYIADRVSEIFARAGIDRSRLQLTGHKRSLGDHLAAYGSVDIALDSFPYHGTTTTCESLWMGVPVVTLPGDRHAARVGPSLLGAVGLSELIAKDLDDYVGKAAELAGDIGHLTELRRTLRERVRRSPLTDEPQFTANLEHTYVDMWKTHLDRGNAGRSLDAGAASETLARAGRLREDGQMAEAAKLYEEVLAARPDHLDALSALWDISFVSGNPGASVDWLNKAISADPGIAGFHYMLGCSLQAQGKVNDAIASFSQALAIEPDYAKGHNNLGCTLEAAGHMEGAIQCYRRAVELDPKLAVGFYNLGNIHRQAGQTEEAIVHLQHALALEPDQAEWQCNLADGYYERLQLDEAVAGYRKALELEPGLARAHAGLGLARLAQGGAAEADGCFRKSLECAPDSDSFHSNLLHSLHYLRSEDRQALFDEHVGWAKRHARGIGWQGARTDEERRVQRPLHVAYLSPDFRDGALAPFIEPVFRAHDRSKVRVFGYSCVAGPDETTRRIQRLCDDWRDVSRLPDERIAERMRFDRIDILVDLAGHSAGGRVRLLAHKPAPLLASWLGYPDTTGLRAVDYRLTDAYADPAGESDGFYSERLVRLPQGFMAYQPPENAPEPGDLPSLSRGRITFGSLETLAKITPPVVAVWSRILTALPGSALVIQAHGLASSGARADLLARFAEHGIDAERLELLPVEPTMRTQFETYQSVDVALDVFPYSGMTTTCEALWMGVPVVTLAGRSHAARMGASILNRAGLPELVAASEEEYIARALALAADGARLRELRATLRDQLIASPLLDTVQWTRGLEATYRQLWNAYAEAGEESRDGSR